MDQLFDNINYENLSLYTAGRLKRFLNYLLDTLFYLLLCIIIGFIIGFTSGLYLLILDILNINDTLNINYFLNNDNKIIDTIFAYVIMFLYYLIYEGIFNRSLAKFITQTKIVSQDGSKPKFHKILIRTLIRFIPFEQLSFIKSGVGLHDNLSKTYVIDLMKIKKKSNNNSYKTASDGNLELNNKI